MRVAAPGLLLPIFADAVLAASVGSFRAIITLLGAEGGVGLCNAVPAEAVAVFTIR